MSDRRESSGDEAGEEQQQETQGSQDGMAGVKVYVMEHKVDTALWVTRALTLLFCLSYFLPFFCSPESSYQKVLMSNAATSALRLHQRVDRVALDRAFFMQLLAEDSAHYLLYSLNFLPHPPVTLVLMPIVLFALLHFASYTLVLFDVAGENNALAPRFLISLVEFQQRTILRGAAFVEIFLMPLTAVNMFFGRVSLLTPIVYYQFLSLRYQSRRNPHTRNMFHELRVASEKMAHQRYMPLVLRNLILSLVQRISSLAPQVQAPH